MARVRVLTDSTADVPPDLAARLGIVVVPAYVQMEGQSLRDGEQISRAEFYRRLPSLSQLPTTAVPSAHEFAAAFRSLVGQADAVLYPHLEIPVSEVGPVIGCHIGPAALGVAGILASG